MKSTYSTADEFLIDYNTEHRACPLCQGLLMRITLSGYIIDLKDPGNFKDNNLCTCLECGNNHTMHSRVPKITQESYYKDLISILVDLNLLNITFVIKVNQSILVRICVDLHQITQINHLGIDYFKAVIDRALKNSEVDKVSSLSIELSSKVNSFSIELDDSRDPFMFELDLEDPSNSLQEYLVSFLRMVRYSKTH